MALIRADMNDASSIEETRAIWDDALEQYENDTEHKPIVEGLRTATSIEDLWKALDTKHIKFKNSREENRRFYSFLQLWFKPIENLAKIGKDVDQVSGVGAILSITCGVLFHLISASKGVSKTFDFITAIFEQLAKYAELLELHVKVYTSIGNRLTINGSSFIKVVGKAEKLVKRGRILLFAKEIVLGEDGAARKMMEDLIQTIDDEQRLVLSEVHVLVADTHKLATKIEIRTKKILDQVLDNETLRRLEYLFKPASTKATDVEHARHKDKIFPGTGAWLLHEPLFAAWKQRDIYVLWILGQPGIGKSVLCTWLIDHLSKQKEHTDGTDLDTCVAYFYISQNNAELQDSVSLFKALAWQLQEQSATFRSHLAIVAKTAHKTMSAEDIWKACFEEYDQSGSAPNEQFYLIIDGLDEAPQAMRKRLINILIDVQDMNNKPSCIQFVVFGRLTIRADLPAKSIYREIPTIEVTSDRNRQDLKDYIITHVNDLKAVAGMRLRGNPKHKTEEFVRMVQRKVFKGAEGVFLWAQIILEEIGPKDEAEITRMLKKPPVSLDRLILAVLERLDRESHVLGEDNSSEISDVSLILIWVCTARRPLTFGEIDVILQLGARATTWTLWEQMRGKFASIFTLRFPLGYDPDASEVKDSSPAAAEEHVDVQQDGFTDYIDDETDSDSESNTTFTEDSSQPSSDDPDTSDLDDIRPVYQQGQILTTVEFTHARFRDIIKEQKDSLLQGKPNLSIFGRPEEMDYRVFLDCNNLFYTATFLSDPAKRNSYTTYASLNICEHLRAIDITTLDSKRQETIGGALNWLFNTSVGCQAWFFSITGWDKEACDALWSVWFSSSQNINLIQTWLRETKHLFSGDQQEWMERASLSAGVLLKGLAIASAGNWLRKRGHTDETIDYKPEFHVWFLRAYTNLSPRGVLPELLPSFSFHWLEVYREYPLSSDEIEDLAGWANLEKTTHWYTGVSFMMQFAGDYDAAIKNAEKAIELDPRAWKAASIKATCNYYQQNFETACQGISKAIEIVPAALLSSKGMLLAMSSIFFGELGDIEKQYDHAKSAWEMWQGRTGLLSWVRALQAKQHWSELLDLFHSMYYAPETSGVLTSYLLRNRLPQGLGPWVMSNGRPLWLLEAAKAALRNQTATRDMIPYTCDLAVFIYEWYDNVEMAVDLFEDVIRRVRMVPNKYRNAADVYLEPYIAKCAQIQFDLAVEQYEAGEDLNSIAAKKLQALSMFADDHLKETIDTGTIVKLYSADYPAQLWGRWLRVYRKADEQIWKECYRSRVDKLINELDDDDPTNDVHGCINLAVTLLQAGDKRAASEIFAILLQPIADRVKASMTNSVAEDDSEESCSTESFSRSDEEADTITVVEGRTSPDSSPVQVADAPATHRPMHVANEWSAAPITEFTSTEANQIPHTESIIHVALSSEARPKLRLHLDVVLFRCNACLEACEKLGSMSFCEICFDTSLCGECLIKVKADTLGRRLCNPKHVWYQAWPIPEGASKAMISSWEAGTATLREEWLANLRKRWSAPPGELGESSSNVPRD